jgi:hypothetical protein
MTKDTKPDHTTYINIPEAVGVFDSFETLQAASVSFSASHVGYFLSQCGNLRHG